MLNDTLAALLFVNLRICNPYLIFLCKHLTFSFRCCHLWTSYIVL